MLRLSRHRANARLASIDRLGVAPVPVATVVDETIKDVEGVRFRTDARPDTPEDDRLRSIQSSLAEGNTSLPFGTTLPHLNYYWKQADDSTAISLWVPEPLRARAVELLEAAGYTVSEKAA
jgi:hypothetical protein